MIMTSPRSITIARVGSNFEREPLVRPIGLRIMNLISFRLRTIPRPVVAAAALAGMSAARAQDVSLSPLAWSIANDAPDQLPVPKSKLSFTFPEELKDTAEIGYVIYDLILDPKGKILGLGPHATLPAYERASRATNPAFAWSAGKRDGKGVYTATNFAVIFNPASAKAEEPDATPRLLEVAAVRVKEPKGAKLGEFTPDRIVSALVSVGADGAVTGVSDAPEAFARAVAIAAKNWRFAPARRAGTAVAAEVRVPFLVIATDQDSIQAGGKRVPPRVTFQQRPIYPWAMQASQMRGEVLVDFIVDIEGRVRNPFVVRSLNPAFDDPAIDAVRKWRFDPGLHGDRPVATHMQVPIVFELDATMNGGRGPLSENRRADLSKLPEELRYDTPPSPRGTVRVVYPYALLRAEAKGKATVNYVVGRSGRVVQATVKDASAPEFGRAVLAAVECFTFEPAIKGGSPGLALQGFVQEFDRSEIQQLLGAEDLAMLRREEKKPESIFTLRDLDAMPSPLSRRPPQFPLAAPQAMKKGEAIIEFLIDEEGRVRLPRIVSATDDSFGYAAVQSVAQWRFEPPMRGGKTVVARAQIPITFGEVPAKK